MQARYYDPLIGRFYSNDPVGYTAKNPVMSFNRYMYVNNNPYKYTDPNGEYLWGINVGAGFTIGNKHFSISISISADHNGKSQLTVNPEYGVSSAKFSVGGFARILGGGEEATVDSLDGQGASVSGSAGPISTSVTLPATYDGSGVIPKGFINGADPAQAVVEVGIGTPSKGEVTVTGGTAFSVETTILGDIGKKLGGIIYEAVNE